MDIGEVYAKSWDDYSDFWDQEPYFRDFKFLGDEWGDDDYVDWIVDTYVKPYLHENSYVCEIGPGGGRYTSRIIDQCAALSCVDVSSRMLAKIQQRFGDLEKLHLFKNDGIRLSPIDDETVDLVYSFNLFLQLELEVIYSYLDEVQRILKPGGVAIIHYATLSSNEGITYFQEHYQEWLFSPKPRGCFTPLSLDGMGTMTSSLGFKVLRNHTVNRDAVIVLEKPKLTNKQEIPPYVFREAGHLTYPILLPKDTQIFFIVGSAKSGTTWLMNTLDAHPEICCKGEMHTLELLDPTNTLLQIPPTLEYAARSSPLLYQWYSMTNNGWNVPHRQFDGLENITKKMERDIVRFLFEWTILTNYMGMKLPLVIGDKSPVHTRFLCRKLDYYYNVYRPFVIHIMRDPRDVALSLWFHMRKFQAKGKSEFFSPFKSEEDEADGLMLLKNPEEFKRQGKKMFTYPKFLPDVFSEWLDVNKNLSLEGPMYFGEKYIFVRYEDLKEDFSGSLRTILQKFRLSNSETIIQTIRDTTDVTKMEYKPGVFRKGLVGEWRDYFDDDDISLFETMLGDFCQKIGYE